MTQAQVVEYEQVAGESLREYGYETGASVDRT
jgi:hypothetical protein